MHSSKGNKKNSKDIIDQLSDEDLNHIFNRMQEFFESNDFKDIVEDIMYDVLADEDEEDDLFKPSFEYEDDFVGSTADSFLVDNELFDNYVEENSPEVLTSKRKVMVTLSLPQARKNDIDLHVTSDYVDITVKTKTHRFHRMIDLPEDVDPCSTKATFTNGVLDIVMRKMGPHNQGCKISLS
jgi:HSP20 family molecular chaperone IbpA